MGCVCVKNRRPTSKVLSVRAGRSFQNHTAPCVWCVAHELCDLRHKCVKQMLYKTICFMESNNFNKCWDDCRHKYPSSTSTNDIHYHNCAQTPPPPLEYKQFESKIQDKHTHKQLSSQCEDDDKDCKVRSMCKNADVKCEPLNDVTISQMKTLKTTRHKLCKCHSRTIKNNCVSVKKWCGLAKAADRVQLKYG